MASPNALDQLLELFLPSRDGHNIHEHMTNIQDTRDTRDTREYQLIKLAQKYGFDLDRKVYGVFSWLAQPCCDACYHLTCNKDYADQMKHRYQAANGHDPDIQQIRIEHGTIINLMKKNTWIPERGLSTHFTFPQFIDKFADFLDRLENNTDYPERIPNCYEELDDISDKIRSVIPKIRDSLYAARKHALGRRYHKTDITYVEYKKRIDLIKEQIKQFEESVGL